MMSLATDEGNADDDEEDDGEVARKNKCVLIWEVGHGYRDVYIYMIYIYIYIYDI